MFRRTFLRLFLLGCLAFALFFALVSTQKSREAENDGAGSETKTESTRPSGEFILESFVGSVLLGMK